ncbi:PEGA domain-containing protein, partial [bacterium]|nr:PEGA domain-containing protein [bacterium]
MQIDGTPEKSPSEIVAVRDANGRLCAGIKVISNLEGFSYDSYNGIVRVDKKPGQDMVYISSNERVLEIFCSGYEPLKIILQEVGIILNPKDVWVIKIHGEIIEELSSSKKGHISLKILPEEAHAHFKIEGLPVEGKSPYEAELIAGKYKIFINPKSPFYNNKVEELTIKEGETTEKVVDLEDISGHLFINVSQTPIKVYIDGEFDYGLSTERQKRLVRGEYKIRVEKDGEDSKFYTPSEETIKIEKREETKKTINLEDISGYLEINCTPKDIKAYVNGEYDEELSFKFRKRLISGKYDIKIESKYHVDSYSKFYHTVNVEKGKTEIIRGELIPEYGTFTVTSNVNGTIFKVIDLETNKCILTGKDINEEQVLTGEYKVSADASSNDYISKPPKNISIQSNEEILVSFKFTNEDKVEYYKRFLIDHYKIQEGGCFFIYNLWIPWFSEPRLCFLNGKNITLKVPLIGSQYSFYKDIRYENLSSFWYVSTGQLNLNQDYWFIEYSSIGVGLLYRSDNFKNRVIINLNYSATYGKYPQPRLDNYKGKKICLVEDIYYHPEFSDMENLEPYNRKINYSSNLEIIFEKFIKKTFIQCGVGITYMFTSTPDLT